MIKIGEIRDRSISFERRFGLEWTENFEVLGIKYSIKNMDTITDDNIFSKISDMKKTSVYVENEESDSIR